MFLVMFVLDTPIIAQFMRCQVEGQIGGSRWGTAWLLFAISPLFLTTLTSSRIYGGKTNLYLDFMLKWHKVVGQTPFWNVYSYSDWSFWQAIPSSRRYSSKTIICKTITPLMTIPIHSYIMIEKHIIMQSSKLCIT